MIALGHGQVVGRQSCGKQAGEVNVEGNRVTEREIPSLQRVACHGDEHQAQEGSDHGHGDGQDIGLPDPASLDNHLIGCHRKLMRDQRHALRSNIRFTCKRGPQDDQEGDNTTNGVEGNKGITKAADEQIRRAKLYLGALLHIITVLCHIASNLS